MQQEDEVDDYIFATFFIGEGNYPPFDRTFFSKGSKCAGAKAFADADLNIISVKKGTQAIEAFNKSQNLEKCNEATVDYFANRSKVME